MSPAIQLSFALRISTKVHSVHLHGSWDNYKKALPLSAVTDGSAKPGSWKGTFRFQGSHALQLGGRYWYYYSIDGFTVSHDPAKEWVVEKTTGRKLNILDVPSGPAVMSATKTSTRAPLSLQTSNLPSSRDRRTSREVVTGRPMSPSKIACPRPQKPYASRGLREADYEVSPIDDLEERFASTRLSDRSARYASSPSELSDSSTSSGGVFSSMPNSSGGSSCSSVGPSCRCERYGVTRDGRRVKLDCGGQRCGYGESSSSDCTSSDEDSEEERRKQRMRARVVAKASSAGSGRAAEGARRPLVIERRPGGRRH
jgi:hypothetical protein